MIRRLIENTTSAIRLNDEIDILFLCKFRNNFYYFQHPLIFALELIILSWIQNSNNFISLIRGDSSFS